MIYVIRAIISYTFHIFRKSDSIPVDRRRATASVELYQFLSFVHDSVQGVVRGMDRKHVGLHACRGLVVCTIFPRNCRNRKLSCKCLNVSFRLDLISNKNHEII